MRIVALGRENLYDLVLRAINDGHDIVLMIICKESDFYQRTVIDFKTLAKDLDIPFVQTENINKLEIIERIKKVKPDIGMSYHWKTLISQEVLDCFPRGVINFHPGDLPRYKGNACTHWAIINGENKIVITLHLMTTELDSGPIILKREIPLLGNTYISEIYDYIRDNCSEIYMEAIDKIKDGFSGLPQDKNPGQSLRCYPRSLRDSEINWNEPAVMLARLVKAVSEPLFGAYTFIGDKKLIVWRAHHEIPSFPFVGSPGQIADRRLNTGEVTVVTGEGLLVLKEVEINGSGRVKPTDVIKTIRTKLGMDVTNEIMRLKQELKDLKEILKKLID